MTSKNNNKEHTAQMVRNFIWALVLVSLAGLMVLSVQRKRTQPLEKIQVHINAIDGNRSLITKKDVYGILSRTVGYDIMKASVKDINLMQLEEVLNNDERVESAEIFIDALNNIRVIIKQRKPIVRIADELSGDYYLDEKGNKMKVRDNSAIRVPVVTGEIETYAADFNDENKTSALKSVFTLASKINEDKFLHALVEQIHVDSKNKMYMIPKVGRQKISLDPEVNLDDKLENLKIFYKDGLPRSGWSKYSELKLDVKDQVIARY